MLKLHEITKQNINLRNLSSTLIGESVIFFTAFQMKTGKKVKEYKSGDFIFAKVKGYRAWPARVQKQNGKKYFVYFYGTAETANLAPNMIFDYAENKDKFLSKTIKRKDFNDGVRQIEHDFANNWIVPMENVIGVPLEQKGKKSKVESKPLATPKSTASRGRPKKEGSKTDEKKEEEEMVGRSGRKIKPRRANLAPNMIFDSSENKDKFLSKTIKRRDFNDGVRQMEDDFANNWIVPMENVIGVPLEKGKKSKVESKPLATPKSTASRGRPKKEGSKTDEKKEEEEMVGRSGRKIKPRRANLAPNMIFDSSENKDKFLSKTIKRKDFNDVVRQMEDDFANNWIVPMENVIGVPLEKGKKSKVESKPLATPKSTASRGRPKKEGSKTDEKKEEEEMVGRSGRKIKPRRLQMELENSVPQNEKKVPEINKKLQALKDEETNVTREASTLRFKSKI